MHLNNINYVCKYMYKLLPRVVAVMWKEGKKANVPNTLSSIIVTNI